MSGYDSTAVQYELTPAHYRVLSAKFGSGVINVIFLPKYVKSILLNLVIDMPVVVWYPVLNSNYMFKIK